MPRSFLTCAHACSCQGAAISKPGVQACAAKGKLGRLPAPGYLVPGGDRGGGGGGGDGKGGGRDGGGGGRYENWASPENRRLMQLPPAAEGGEAVNDAGLTRREVLAGRAAAVAGGMGHAWRGYRAHAWGMDNLLPVSGRGSGSGFGHAVTLVDSLDSLWLMGLKAEFAEARNWCAQELGPRLRRIGGGTSLFETTIRTLGGLLAAFDLSEDPLFKDLAKLLGDKVSAQTSSEGVSPYTFGGGSGGMGCPSLAESGTMQVEMNYLSKITGNPRWGQSYVSGPHATTIRDARLKISVRQPPHCCPPPCYVCVRARPIRYALKANAFYDTIKRKPSLDGLWPNCWQHGHGKITFGADGDSFYEYLVKGWLQSGKTDDRLWRMYNDAIDGLEKWLVRSRICVFTLYSLRWQKKKRKEELWFAGSSECVIVWVLPNIVLLYGRRLSRRRTA